MRTVPDWKPIESAPKDGTAVLVAIAGSEYWPEKVHWAPGGWRLGCERHRLTMDPTHWLPLPENPEVTSADDRRPQDGDFWVRRRDGRSVFIVDDDYYGKVRLQWPDGRVTNKDAAALQREFAYHGTQDPEYTP